uniref:HIT family protein n=1 Tax=Nocardia pseudovaccinii TaxID=189540 RepID=UPI0035A25DA2
MPEQSLQHSWRLSSRWRALCGTPAASGINLVHATGRAAHQTVFHFHVHVVPRYDGDSIVVFPRLADPARKHGVSQRLRTALTDQLPPMPDAESSHCDNFTGRRRRPVLREM